jgi:hypothetical protein
MTRHRPPTASVDTTNEIQNKSIFRKVSEITENISFWNFTKTIIIIGILAPILVTSINSYYSDFTEKQNLAQAYKTEIINLKPFLSEAQKQPLSVFFIDPNNTANNSLIVQQKVDSLYPSWGLYNSNPQLLSKFDKNLSAQLYLFYYRIQRAEEMRKVVIGNNQEIKNLRATEGSSSLEYLGKANSIVGEDTEMHVNINLASESIPSLIDGLNETINAKPLPFVYFP